VIASMNPYDNIGTTRLSTSVHDRLCRLAVTYQDVVGERGIVSLRALLPDLKQALYERLVADAVAVTRATREHEDIRQGSSARCHRPEPGRRAVVEPRSRTGAALRRSRR
jgi:MoxR-like ATPase